MSRLLITQRVRFLSVRAPLRPQGHACVSGRAPGECAGGVIGIATLPLGARYKKDLAHEPVPGRLEGLGSVGEGAGPTQSNPPKAGSIDPELFLGSGSREVPTNGGLLASDFDASVALRSEVGARWGGECTPRSSAQPFRVKVDWDPPMAKVMAQRQTIRQRVFLQLSVDFD